VNAWLLLGAAGLLEIAWALGLKASEGFTKPLISVATGAAIIASLSLLGLAARTLPIGTAYAVWSGIGAAGALIFGIVFFGEPAAPARIACVGLIIAGIVGLKLVS
jgi:quaternary ammonium compound-resistance protein SugE